MRHGTVEIRLTMGRGRSWGLGVAVKIASASRPHFAAALGRDAPREGQLDEGTGMMLRRAGLGLLVGAVLMAPSGASAGPALVFEPYNGTVFYAEDPDAAVVPGIPHQVDDRLCRLPGVEGRHRHARQQGRLLAEGDGASPDQARVASRRHDHARYRAQGADRQIGQRRRRDDRRDGGRQRGGVRRSA